MLFKNAPIRRKLISIILLTSCAVLLIEGVSFMVYEYFSFRKDVLRRTTTMAVVIAANSTAALIFDNHADATEVLASVSAEPHIVAAGLYNDSGALFAHYPDTSSLSVLPTTIGEDGFRFVESDLVGYQPVIQSGKRVGTLYFRVDLTEMRERLLLYSGVLGVIFLASLAVAFGISHTLQKQISQPILHLARVAQAVSEQGNYSVRAVPSGRDELGLLTSAFNHMLTQIEQTDLLLRRSEERFRLMIENVKDYAIIMLDANGNVLTWNSGAERLYGFRTDEIIDQPFTTFFISDEITRRMSQSYLERAGTEGSAEYERWHIRPDGSRFFAHIVLTAVRDFDGQLRGYSKVTRDITQRHESEEEIRRLNANLEKIVSERTAQLERAVQELEAFAYSVSHDLRTPLRAIDGFTQVLLDNYASDLPAGAKEHLMIIQESSTAMGQLIEALLAFSRLSRQPLNERPIDTQVMVETVLREVGATQREWHGHVHVGELPQSFGDPSLIKQVWENLISNAVKYTRKRTQPSIEIGVSRYDGETAFFVKDNGTGFDMKYYAKLFEVFQRLHRAEDYEGTGVGLAIVKRIIDRHGGHVWAQGEKDKGATFYFVLAKRS